MEPASFFAPPTSKTSSPLAPSPRNWFFKKYTETLHLIKQLRPWQSQSQLTQNESVLKKHTEAFNYFYKNCDGDHKAAKYNALAAQRYIFIYSDNLNEWKLFGFQTVSPSSERLNPKFSRKTEPKRKQI